MELGRQLTDLETEMPPGDFYTHVLEVVCPENLKLFINLTFFEFLLMLDQ